MSKKKICLDESQTKRLMNDTVKLAKGLENDDICPTVKEMYDENVDQEVKEVKKGGRQKKDMLEKAAGKIERKMKNKVKGMFGKVGEWF